MITAIQPASTLSLKEWAVAVKALGEGKQIITVRKGGLYEETREFVLEHDTFYLYPTYEHQKPEMVKPAYHADLEATLEGWSPDQPTVPIRYFAHITDDVELLDEAKLRALNPYHIWTDNFADVRLHWKKKKPLHILFARVYRLHQAIELPIAEEYKGCKSWHHLLQEIPQTDFTPVLTDEEYQAKRAEIMDVLR
ncbi:DUF1802 family protein [Brevibacillus humidisoli]|uniref:DUF1802 family protein n=1 Tax=Brevibacillus humidisoli TaxID=2895522 RepID=UPI001E44BED2|nr:DUF1802 family protein [Brevibacillus humidisoli]UFJ43353.1 DUF1802 family protein [Brevibacillus humidisoli]